MNGIIQSVQERVKSLYNGIIPFLTQVSLFLSGRISWAVPCCKTCWINWRKRFNYTVFRDLFKTWLPSFLPNLLPTTSCLQGSLVIVSHMKGEWTVQRRNVKPYICINCKLSIVRNKQFQVWLNLFFFSLS